MQKTLNKFIRQNRYKIDKDLSLDDKKRKVIDTIIKVSDLKGTNKELSEQLSEILEEGFEDMR